MRDGARCSTRVWILLLVGWLPELGCRDAIMMRWLPLLLLACACGPSAPPSPPKAATPAKPVERAVAPASAPPEAPESTPPESASLVLPADYGSAEFRGLRIEVIEVVEKRMMNGAGMMRATLRLRARELEENVELSSEQPVRSWNGYELRYDDAGWRSEVRLKVRYAAP